MDNKIIKPEVIQSVAELSPKRVVPKLAYQMEESGTGGYFLYRIILDDNNKMVSRAPVSNADAWDQVIGLLEMELAKQFQ